MHGKVRNFELGQQWSDKDGVLTDRAAGMLRSLFNFTGATTGFIPLDSMDQTIIPTWTGLHTFSGGIKGGAFGANGKTPQTAATVSAAVTGTAGVTYTATEQAMLNNVVALTNQLRAALVANGIAI